MELHEIQACRERLTRAIQALPQNTATGWAKGFRFALAYSGGLDSRFLAFAAQKAGLDPLLVHACGPHLAPGESAGAAAWAEQQGLTLLLLPGNPLPQVGMNDKERCYRCKKALFQNMLAVGLPLADGSNASDAMGYRPGRKALHELGVYSPLEEAGLAKPQIRAMAAHMGMDNPGQPSHPCMLTRLNYGLKPRVELLNALGQAEVNLEKALAPLLNHKPDLRLRLISEEQLELHMLEAMPQCTGGEDISLLAQKIVQQENLPCLAAIRWNQGSGYFDTIA